MGRTISKIRALAIDFDGVVFRGDVPIPGAPAAIGRLHSLGMAVFFLTNNSSKTRADYRQKLAAMGIAAGEDEIFTAGYGTALYLAAKHPNKNLRLFVIGESGLKSELAAKGFTIVDSVGWDGKCSDGRQIDYVISGIDRQFNYQKLHSALNAIVHGAKFVASNTDATWPVEHGLLPGSGSLVAAISACSGKQPDAIIGKPNTYLLELIQKKAKCKKSNLALIDDRLDTGVAVANKFGITSILVLTGATSKKQGKAARGIFKPKATLNSIASLPEFLERAKQQYAKKLLALDSRHFKKHGKRKMSLKELDRLCGVR